MSDNSCESKLALATPFAYQALNIPEVATRLAQWCDNSGEPAIFIKTHNDARVRKFPLEIQFYRMDPHSRQSILIQTVDLDRPNYSKEVDGFDGRHVVVSILHEVSHAIRSKVTLPIETFTGEMKWREFCAGPDYFSLLEQRALDNTLNTCPKLSPAPSKKRL